MERALDLDMLADAIGEHRGLPTPIELQRLIADLEVALFIRQREVPASVIAAGWYLHGVASADPSHQIYGAVRQRRAFTVSAHIFDLASSNGDLSRPALLEYGFAAAIGYMRGGLEPNATAMYRRQSHLLIRDGTVDSHIRTLAIEAGIAFLGLQTRDLFSLFSQWRRALADLAVRVGLERLEGTSFGTAEAVVLGAEDLLFYLAFGREDRLASARTRLLAATRGEAGPDDVDGRWVASHLLSVAGQVTAGSVWSILPPNIPSAARQAFCFASPPVLTLWEPQRELLIGDPSPVDASTRRLVVSVPTSAGKTLIGQVIMVTHLATAGSSVCYVTPTRSLGREVRRALASRVRIIQREVGLERPDLPFSGDMLEALSKVLAQVLADPTRFAEPPDVDVMTPERLAFLLRRDPTEVLERYGLFVFDEAQLIGEAGRGFTAEGILAFLHWRTLDTHHRIVLLSAAMGNSAQMMAWLSTDTGNRLQTSDWRGPRRLHAVFTTEADWSQETRTASRSPDYPVRLTYPLIGTIRLRVAEGSSSRRLRVTRPVGQLAFKASKAGQRGPRDAGMTTPNYKAAAQMVAAIGHAGSVLVVTSTRDAARRMAEELARIAPSSTDVAPLIDFTRLRLGDAHPLVQTLRSGVAFHHAALPTDVLEALEDGLRDDRIKYLTCTSTLTEGVNLPVRTVVIAETRYEGQPEDAQISGARLINALGRAGRAGRETEGWLVLVRADRPMANDFALLAPTDADLAIRSQLTTDRALAELAAFEDALGRSGDAIYDAVGPVGDFIAYVWFVLAAEEAIHKSTEQADVAGALRATLGFQQLTPDAQKRWLNIADATRASYARADPLRRRTWSRSGTSIGTARTLDAVSDDLIAAIKRDRHAEPPPESVSGGLALLRNTGALQRLLTLPERPGDWSFHETRSTRSSEVVVDINDLLTDWLKGAPLSALADRFLLAVPDESWRIEQLVDAVTAHFEHFLSWTVGAVVELVNQQLHEIGTGTKLCPQLGVFIRNGVDSDEALALMLAGIRSRGLANRIVAAARAANEAHDIGAWLALMSINDWRTRFDASASEVLDLLDLTRQKRRSGLRTLLQDGVAEFQITVPAGVDQEATAIATIGVEARHLDVIVKEETGGSAPRALAISTADTLVAYVPAASHTDVQSIIDTGLPVASTIEISPTSQVLRFRLTET